MENIESSSELVYLYYSIGVCVIRQFNKWSDGPSIVTLMPSREVGWVTVASSTQKVNESRPWYGWVLHRPMALELTFPAGVRIDPVAVQPIDMQMWYAETEPWVHLKTRNAIMPTMPVTRGKT